MNEELYKLPAAAAAEAIREGYITSEALVESCLERIDAREDEVRAWTYLDRDYALEQAREADRVRKSGQPIGPLQGVPVGVKDIFDTVDMPTEDGTVLHAGRRPIDDAFAVSQLRKAGAVILGKTVTTELAVFHPGKTRNPHDPAHTPGGSSSGSAAAVADSMVPLALGTQTNGSTIRPASFCGVVGYKPTFGLIPRAGVLEQSPPLDQVGVFARSVEDAALLAETLVGQHPDDPYTRFRATPPLLATARQDPPVEPKLAFVRSPVWDQAEAETQEAFAELVDFLGDAHVEEYNLGEGVDDVIEWHRCIMEADLAYSFARDYDRAADQLSDVLRGMIERGREVTAIDYNRAVRRVERINRRLHELFIEFDAVLTPATPGPAPAGLDTTGSPVFCTLWTYLGTPAISLPLLQGSNGLPLGVQLVGERHDDARLLRNARWLAGRIQQADAEAA